VQTNINAYDPDKFKNKFVETEIYQKLISDYENVCFENNFHLYKFVTPRQIFAQGYASYFSAVPFYYLDFLLGKNPQVIYDLGCGWNIFKKYIPNIVGVGAEDPESPTFYADIHDYVDDDYIKGHQNYFESVFSINALHFIPLSDLKNRVLDFYSMLKPNGVGWLALNLQRMIERDIKNFDNKDQTFIDTYIRDTLSNIGIDYIVFDVDLTIQDEQMNGNIRLVMQKK